MPNYLRQLPIILFSNMSPPDFYTQKSVSKTQFCFEGNVHRYNINSGSPQIMIKILKCLKYSQSYDRIYHFLLKCKLKVELLINHHHAMYSKSLVRIA